MLSQEETALKNSLNDRIRGAWTRAKWPDVQTVVEKSVAAVNKPHSGRQGGYKSTTHPTLWMYFKFGPRTHYTDRNAILLGLPTDQRLPGTTCANSTASSVFIVGNQVPASDYGTGTTDLPAIFREIFVTRLCLSRLLQSRWPTGEKPWHRSRWPRKLRGALELDRVERLNSMNKITINSPIRAIQLRGINTYQPLNHLEKWD